ncbi:MAG: hypothetical protein K0U98_12990 [Deltaproteobacteria bacterium]|nr:hypothetical protein [Deltaproteobacteria bacterium]
MRRKENIGALIALAFAFFFPTLLRMFDLVEAGSLRAVDTATIFAGGFVCGVLITRAISSWRAQRLQSEA